MLKKVKPGYYFLEKFAGRKNLIHGFSTRPWGDMRVKKSLRENQNLDRFLGLFAQKTQNLVMMNQVHRDRVQVVGQKDRGRILPRTDGIISDQEGIILGVRTADCLPILFYDQKKKVVGAAHAGWRGVLKKIARSMIEKMKSLGCRPQDILVGIGPHIEACCYIVPQARVAKFQQVFGDLKGMVFEDDQGLHLNLTLPTIAQLVETGVLEEKIEFGSICTSCRRREFFSFRRDTQATFGEMVGIIGLLPQT